MKTILLNIIIFTFIGCGPSDLLRDTKQERKNNCERAVLVTSAYYADEQLVNKSENKEEDKNIFIIYLLLSCSPGPGE